MLVHTVYQDTIFALSSGNLPSGVAVLRISGTQTRFIIETFSGNIPEPRHAVYRKFYTKSGEILDQGLLIYFSAPKSFTGEDSAEFHIHGGIAVVEKFLEELSAIEHCRLAEAGEFTRRAFANGKMDLTMAEGLADLISSETESQRRLAQQVASGVQRDLYANWRQKLLQARAYIEAELDFSDEGDVPGSISERVWEEMRILSNHITEHIKDGKRATMLRNGLDIVIIGAPNAGKSSLLNILAAREAAIISDEAGTTRDLIEVKLNLDGVIAFITDTAGIREATGKIERIGIERALEKASEADLILYIEDLNNPQTVETLTTDAPIWTIGNKIDLAPTPIEEPYQFLISTKSKHGIEDLISKLTEFAIQSTDINNSVVPTRRRHIDLLNNASTDITAAIEHTNLPLELRAEHLRHASQHLGKITGDIDVEDILDVVFSQFCIGK